MLSWLIVRTSRLLLRWPRAAASAAIQVGCRPPFGFSAVKMAEANSMPTVWSVVLEALQPSRVELGIDVEAAPIAAERAASNLKPLAANLRIGFERRRRARKDDAAVP